MLINELIGNYFAKVYRANTGMPICGCNPSNRTQYSASFREYSVRKGMVRSIQL